MSVIADRSDTSADAAVSVGQDLYLEVVLNGSATRRIAHFTRDDTHFYAGSDTLRQLGFRNLPEVAQGGRYDLAALPEVSFAYDEEHQRCTISAPPRLLDQAPTVLNTPMNAIPRPQASPGLLLNYDLYATRDNSGSFGLSASSELRAFNAWGVLSTTELSRVTNSPGTDWGADSVRLDTTFSRSFVDSTTSLRIGDVISGNLAWTRATRLGGIQLQRDFALQPDLITFPVPAFYGQANLPSTIDLYINGLKQYSHEVPAGPFQLNTLPVVNGNGQAQVVVTDAMGRQNTLDFSFYTANQLLRAGLSDYSLEAGFARTNYGTQSFSYASNPAASGTYRYGVADWLTVEGHAEATAGVTNGGAGAIVEVGRAGIVNVAGATSNDHGRSGSQIELGYNWRNDRFNFSVDSLRSFDSYRDVASLYGQLPPKRADRAVAGLMLGQLGSVGMSYVQQQYPSQTRSRFASAYYFKSLGSRCSFNLSANQNLDEHNDRSVFLGISLSLGGGTSVNLSTQHDRSGNLATLDASRPIDADGGYGWRARVQDGNDTHGGQVEVGYRAEQGQLLAGVESLNDATRAYADVSGALVFMDSQFFAARRIDDAFAVVSTDGVAGVPVMLENRPIGTTNAGGDLLVTPLNAYQRNTLAIDPMQLPADVRIDRVDADVVPSDRAGTLVRFAIQPVAAASIVLHDGADKPLSVGSTVQLQGKPASNGVIGYDGIVYLEGLDAHDTLDVQTPTGRCQVKFDYHAEKQTVPVIGPLVCRGETP
ncbi:MAG: fimbria/pilus outer membrane usher protein [Casimicrobiaceae bacterium]